MHKIAQTYDLAQTYLQNYTFQYFILHLTKYAKQLLQAATSQIDRGYTSLFV